MPQVSTSIPEDIDLLIRELSEDSGESMSSLMARFITEGAYDEAESRNKVKIYRKMRQPQK